jgi:L-aminopeptidase/D-esterase-like protein
MFYPVFQSRRAHTALARGGRAYAEEEIDGDAAHALDTATMEAL